MGSQWRSGGHDPGRRRSPDVGLPNCLGDASRAKLEANHDRFWFQADAPDFFHTMLNLVFEGEDVGGCGSAAIDDGEGVFAGDADAARAESLGEAGTLDQPGSGNFLASF